MPPSCKIITTLYLLDTRWDVPFCGFLSMVIHQTTKKRLRLFGFQSWSESLRKSVDTPARNQRFRGASETYRWVPNNCIGSDVNTTMGAWLQPFQENQLH